VAPIPFDDYVAWLGDGTPHRLPSTDRLPYLADPEPTTVRELDDGVLYVRYRNVVTPSTARARELVDAGEVRRLVLDLRQNPGGDNGTYGSVLELVQDFADQHPGELRVLIDRVTFSAASNLATEIERSTDAVFIGEPMAGGLNFWNDVTQVRLDALPVPMQVGVSTRYWEFAEPDDRRLTIEPDVLIEASAEDFLTGRDPVLEAAIGD
jgi:C-terminal processing protease CtpA/Prc